MSSFRCHTDRKRTSLRLSKIGRDFFTQKGHQKLMPEADTKRGDIVHKKIQDERLNTTEHCLLLLIIFFRHITTKIEFRRSPKDHSLEIR